MKKKDGYLKKSFVCVVFLFFSYSSSAFDISVDAYGKTLEQAKKEALASLSESLVVEIKSTFKSLQDSAGQLTASKMISIQSELPLLGVEQDCRLASNLASHSEYVCSALLSSEHSISFYHAELNHLKQQLEPLNSVFRQQQVPAEEYYHVLQKMLLHTQRYNKLLRVAQILSPNMKTAPVITMAQIQNKIFQIERSSPSLNVMAKIISRELPDKLFYIYPALPEQSKQATQLSKSIKDSLQLHIRTTSHPDKADLILRGSYQILDNSINLIYSAVTEDGSIVVSKMSKLAPSAYQGITYLPNSVNFDQLLHEGYVVSNDFKAEINTNLGKNDLLFTQGDSIELFVKLNKSGFFYIVSHNLKDNMSYLLELNEARGNRAFIRFINADDANHWVSLGEFEANPPFGTENLQLIASDNDFNALPINHYDSDLGLYVLKGKTAQQAVIKTRALTLKGKKNINSAEASLSFTTMKK